MDGTEQGWQDMAEADSDQIHEIDPDAPDPIEPAGLADSQQIDEIDPDADHGREPGDLPEEGG